MDIDLSQCDTIREDLEDVQVDVKEKYESDWDDDVKESFAAYIAELNTRISSVNQGIDVFREAVHSIEDIDMDVLKAQCQQLESTLQG